MILVDFIKAKHKAVMTKRELVFYTIKTYICMIVVLGIADLLILSTKNESALSGMMIYIMFGLVIALALVTPGLKAFLDWKRWHKQFPTTLFINPKTREKMNLPHREINIDSLAYLIAMDELLENRFKLTEEDQEYILYIIDSYHEMKLYEDINAPYEKNLD